ncbi:thioredoxin family protein [Flavobacterium sp. JLP]|uniref:thioredoxin family protein n=1 Tax=unclassified Flavobacterium TaxID=196869 RepID=UPI00188AA9F4|nr:MULTISPECIES: thioredoxin family protein [unclassified Flavobacterium]MBF4494075.1 thioredoxin family protein [Flavobacterium sp. MR2016-29]MBF4506660.1 thioredoxin family protein [Flavobacterium sp. JLP]
MTRKLLILLFFLGSFFMHSQNVWKTTMTEAVAASVEQRKPLFIFFTIAGAPQRFQNEIFNTPDFAVWARENVVLVRLDLSDPNISDAEKEQNVMLKNALGVTELPQVCFTIASVRKQKTTFNLLGKLPFKPIGAVGWMTEANIILRPE